MGVSKRSSEREPADSLRYKLNTLGGWFPSLTLAFGLPSMKIHYTLSCYGSPGYIFSVPLRASEAWLKKSLRRRTLISGGALSSKQVRVLQKRVMNGVEVSYCPELEYFLEGQMRK